MIKADLNCLPFNLEQAIAHIEALAQPEWAQTLRQHFKVIFAPGTNGNLPRWLATLKDLPKAQWDDYDFTQPIIQIGDRAALNATEQAKLKQMLLSLSPWRKGPFNMAGISIDAEWRSDLKWQRLAEQIDDLSGRLVLDVGSGNGYYALRMVGAGARQVVMVDPSQLALCQFTALRQALKSPPPITFLPVGIDQVPQRLALFDTVFSMGVLYHRRSPLDHLNHLRQLLRPGGQLVLETLVIPGKAGQILVPESRYAQMRNVWFLPSVDELIHWLKRIGFDRVVCINESNTMVQEQRRTQWMSFHSLSEFLDPNDAGQTIEGYPAPRRAIIAANT